MSLRTTLLTLWTLLNLVPIAHAAPDDPRPARPSIRVDVHDPARSAAVEVSGIDAENLSALKRLPAVPADLFSVFVSTQRDNSPPVAGRLRIEGETLRFEPRFPFDRGLSYKARFRPSVLPLQRADLPSEIVAEVVFGPGAQVVPTMVVRVDPSGEILPENLLKFYVQFSAPMARGEAYERVRLVDAKGQPIEGAFLEIGEELWNATGTRLTLLLDPGRIKRGLRPREEDGPILEAGKSYRLVIDAAWPDASGHPLTRGFSASFRCGPADETQPDPKSWTVAPPRSSSKAPLKISFPEPLDHALLGHCLTLLGPDGQPVAGKPQIGDDSRSWSFHPFASWISGTYRLAINPDLEDLCGNSVARRFEVDAIHPDPEPGAPRSVSLPIEIRDRSEPRSR